MSKVSIKIGETTYFAAKTGIHTGIIKICAGPRHTMLTILYYYLAGSTPIGRIIPGARPGAYHEINL